MEKNIIIAGFGGQGVLLAGEVLANAFMFENKHVTWYPSYGAEMRGGTVNCEIVVSDEEVSAVNKKDLDYLVALNQLSFDKFLPKLKKGATVIANSTLINKTKPIEGINYVFAPLSEMATELGNVKMTNILSLGLLSKHLGFESLELLENALDTVLPVHRKNLLPLNFKALKLGYQYDLLPA